MDPNDPQSWNRYAYVEGDPLDSIDPMGMLALKNPCTLASTERHDGSEAASFGPYSPDQDGADAAGDADAGCGGVCFYILGEPYCIPTGAPLNSGGTGGGGNGGGGGGGGGNNQINTHSPTGPACASAAELNQFLQHTPLAGEGEDFIAAGQQYGVDPRFIVSLADAESSLGRNITRGAYNAWNWMYNEWPTPSPFTSWANGIQTVTRGIAQGHYYFTQNRFSAASIYYTPGQANQYCTAGDCTGGIEIINSDLILLGGNPNDVRLPAACREGERQP